MRGCIGASSDGISLSLVTCRGNAWKGGGILCSTNRKTELGKISKNCETKWFKYSAD